MMLHPDNDNNYNGDDGYEDVRFMRGCMYGVPAGLVGWLVIVVIGKLMYEHLAAWL